MIKFIIYLFFVSVVYCVEKPRGISFSKLSFYQPNVPFKCLDGSGTISWSKVNDDYCDCRDASDEPGTAACSNGLFHCDNKGHRGIDIYSSRVNDGICDCCDGGDEYSGLIHCNDTCWEIGEKTREHNRRIKEAAVRGYEVYLQYIKEYETSVSAKKTRLDIIKDQLQSVSEERLTVERSRSDAEAVEKEAKSIAEERWKILQAENETIAERSKIILAFKQLDMDDDGRVTFEELQNHHEFDIDQNGEVSVEEAKEYLNEHEFVDEQEFVDVIWSSIKQIFKFKEIESPKIDDFDGSVPDPSDHPGEDEHHTVNSASIIEKSKMEFDDATQALIDAADLARTNYNVINDKYSKLEEEKRSIEDLLNIDYGSTSSFYVLADSDTCYEMTDREYTYKYCPFKKTVQMPKDGGSETELGKWGRWSGEEDVYSQQTYENGSGCWNGPNRSTKVAIECGEENKLISVSEPSRCEYRFEFQTPAACTKSSEELSHDEL